MNRALSETTNVLLPQGRIRESILVLSVLAVCAIIAYLPSLLALILGLLDSEQSLAVTNRDFINYWMAGRLLLHGNPQLLFSQQDYFAEIQKLLGPDFPIHNWSYPPHFLLLLWPLGFFGYKPSLLLFLALTFAIFVYSTARFRAMYAPDCNLPILCLALLGFVLTTVNATQNGFLTAALLLLGLVWMRRRPALAGLAFSVLTIKPQLGFLIPVLLVLDRNWMAIGWAATFTTAWIALSAVVFGLDCWRLFLSQTIPYQIYVMTDWHGIFLRMMPTVFGSIRTLGFSPDIAKAIQWPISIVATVLAPWAIAREGDALRRIFLLMSGTLLISPYAFNYDMGALTVVAAMLLGSQDLRRPWATKAVTYVAGLASIVMLLGLGNVPIAPILLVAGFVAVAASTMPARSTASSERADGII